MSTHESRQFIGIDGEAQTASRRSSTRAPSSSRTFIGVDGEGQTVGRGVHHIGDHRYVFLAASSEQDKHWSVENESGLSTETCLDFLLETVPHAKTLLFAYSFGYDLTKILVDLPDEKLYSLFRPDERLQEVEKYGKVRTEPAPVRWRGYSINLQGSKLTLARSGREVVLWDLFKFYQSKFVNALKDWKVGDDALHQRMQLMKDKRSEFDKLPKEQVQAYCYEECACMARLARKLVDAHEKAGLKLKTFYGAGSSASAMLTAMGIKDKIRGFPPEMHDAVARAFFGGRFENSVIGRIDGTVYNYDISSAYPYQITFLPCLEHGQWRHTTDRGELERARTAFVRYALGDAPDSRVPYPGGSTCGAARGEGREASSFAEPNKDAVPLKISFMTTREDESASPSDSQVAAPQVPPAYNKYESWGPFPFRTDDGSISFPIESGGGWVGKDEYLAGERLFPHVSFVEAWVYDCDCDCQPFARIPEFYSLRIAIGKEGPGIVLKLGYNACYGKLAQSVGGAVFSSWVWAALITSGTRAQILDLLGQHSDWRNLLMVATDGIYTRERLDTPPARDTGTGELPSADKCTCLRCKTASPDELLRIRNEYETSHSSPTAGGPDRIGHLGPLHVGHKPLGGWEEKRIDNGVFVARPGIYFPMNPTEKELKDVRGRGVGKGIVLENWRKIVDHWERHGLETSERYPGGLPCVVSNVSRFCGAKSSIHRNVARVHASGATEWDYGRANGLGDCAMGCRHVACGHVPSYGQWITRPVEMSFNPMPKRAGLNADGMTLRLRKFPRDLQSAAYAKAVKSEEALELERAKEELLEQPDGDFGDADLSDLGHET